MKHKYPLPLFFACFLLISTIALTAPIFSVNTFLTPSATIAGSTTICQNSAMPIVTFTGSGGSAPYTFEYTINNGSTLTISTTDSDNSVSIPVNTGTSGTFTYTLVGVSDSVDIDIETQSGSAVIAVQPTPDTSMGGTGSGSVYEGVSVFRVCMNTSSLFNFTNTSSTQGGLNTNYTIDWGDGSPNFSGNSWSVLSHTYDVGLWNVMYTVEGNNGCSSTQNYIVFVGSNPAVSLGNPGNTDVCNTSSLTFPITGTENNPPGTTYTVTFNDGSESEVFNHPPPASVTHTFLTSSCGINSSDGTNTYENSFSANILASNPCSSSSVGVVPIYVSTAPEANFDSPEIGCINTSVCLTNQSIGDTNIGSSSACNTTPNIIWSISPDTGFTISSGSLGNDFGLTDASSWFSGSDELCLSFSESGTYTITQNAGNTCGFDSISETICIDTPLTPIFNLDEISICGPDEVNAINNTDESLSCSDVTYLWEVDYTSDFCNSSTTGSWSFINGTDLNTINASFNFVTPGVYTISLTVSNSCGEETTTQNVNVKQPPKVEINSIADVCNTFNISPSAIISECTDDSTSMTYAWSFVGATPATSNLENPGEIVYATPGTYTITLKVTNDCGVYETATETFTIKETPVITNTNLSQSICSGSYTDAIDLTASVVGTTFSWTAVGTTGVSGFTTSGTTNTIAAQLINTTSTASGSVTYTVIPTSDSCIGDAIDFVITVNPAPQIVTQPQSSSVCQNGAVAILEVSLSSSSDTPTYQWYSNTLNSTTGGTLIPGANGSTYQPLTDTIGIVYYYCELSFSSQGCSVLTSEIAAIEVTENATILTQPIATQTLCVDGTTDTALQVEYTGGNGTVTYQWYSNTSNLATGGIAISGATNSTYTPDVFITAGTYYFYVELNFNISGCGNVVSEVAEVIVSELPVIDVQPIITQTLCQTVIPQNLEVEASGGVGTFSYQWYSNTLNTSTGGTIIPGATSEIYTPLTDVVGTLYYYCVVSQSVNSSCTVTSAISEVIVNEAPSFINQPISQALCLGDTVSDLEMTYTNGVGTTTLQWYSNITNDTATGTEISGAINNIYSPDVSIIGTTYYYGIITFSEGGCSEIISDIAEISVSETPEIITQAIATQTLCESITPQDLEVEVSGTTGIFSYQWYSNTSNSTTGGTEISGATSETYTPETDAVGTTYYYVEIYNTLNDTCKVVSAISEVIVNEAPSFINQPVSQALCFGAMVNDLEMTYTNGVGTASLQWYSNTVNSSIGGTIITGAIDTTYSPDVSIVGTTYYYGIITFSEGGCTEIISDIAEISVSETPEIITQAIATQTLCESITPQGLEVEVSGTTGVFSYQWYSNGSNSTTGGTEISGATSETYTPETDAVGTTYYYVEIYNTLNDTCKVVSAISEVIVNEAPAFVEQPSSQALCLGDTVSDLEMTYENGVGTATLQWYSNTVNDTATGIEISGATSTTYTPDVSVAGTTYFYGIITFSEGGCTEIISEVAVISVSETPEIITQAVATQTLCESITPQDLEVEISGTTGVFSYQWYSNGSNSTTGGTEITGATSETYTPETDVIGTTYYYVEIYNTLNSTCKVVSAISEVIVNEAPAFVEQPSSQALCLGDTVSDLEMTYQNGVGTATLQWYSNTANNTATGIEITGATNNIYSPDVSIIGTTYYYGIITFSEGGCSEIISDIAEISVSEVPVIDTQALATQTLCESITATTLELTVSGGVDVFSYQWYSNGSNSTTGGTEITGATSETYTPETDAVGTTYYYVEIYNTLNDTCKVVSAISEVIVNEAPAFVEQPESEILCLGESASVLEMSYINGVGVPGLQWHSNTVNSSIGGTIITGAIDSTYSPDVSIVGTTYYYGVITFSEGGCSEIVSDVVEIIVNDTPSIDDLAIVVCSEKVFTVNPDATNGSSVPANTTYTWNMPTVSPLGSITGISEENNPQTEISQVLTNNTTSPAVVTYVVTPVSGLCIGENFTIEVTVNPSISTEIIVVNSFCFESNSGSISAVISGGVPFSTGNPYIINWMGPNGFVADTATISNLEPGDYVLTIDDEGGCPLSETYTITEPEILSMVVDTETSISCFEAADGEITISVSGGTLNYTYNWTKDGIPFSTDEDIYNLEPGNYEITISDANNCGPVNQAFLITEPDELEVSLASKDDVLCYGFSTGSINITTIGGTPTEVSPGVFDYNYQWTGPNGFLSSTSDLIGLIAGTYQLTVTDANNCSDTLNVTLTQPDEIVINYTFTEITCYGAEDASINITSITGGAGIFDIAWNNFAEGLVQNNLSAGDYIVTVTDADNCEMSTTITIPEAPIFAISPDIEHVSCFGANDGRITLNFQGGQDPIDVIWDDDSTAGVERNNLAPGTYNLTISDGTPCYIYETFTILEPDILAITANISNAFDCDDPNSGAINLIITGGTTPYTVNWSNGSTTEDLNNIPPGTYFVEVVDANGCEISDSYTIVRPSPIVVDVITETEADCDNVNVTQTFVANVSGGVPPYQLNWSNGTVSGVNNEFMNTTQNGLVILEATDDLGCVSSFTFEVDIPELSAADFETTSIAYQTYGLYSMADPIEFFNTTSGDYESVFWDFGDGNFSSEENPTHIYTSEGPYVVTQTVTFPFGCVYTKVVTLIIEKGYKLIMPNAFSPNQDGINDYFTPVYIGLDDMELNIYDTWGSLIYTEANDDIQGWDGTVNGESAENGNYYYTFTAKTFYGSKIKENGAFVSIK